MMKARGFLMRLGRWILSAILAGLSLVAVANEITFELAESGNVSAAIYDAGGRMVREVWRAEPRPAGRQVLSWDGLDQSGAPVSAGEYEWRVLRTQGLRSEFVMSVGTSVGKRWWPGNHDGPQVLTVAEGSLIVGANPEGPPLLTRCTLEGGVIWERQQFEAARAPYDVAAAGERVFYLQDNGKVFVLDFATGQPVAAPLPALFPVKSFDFVGVAPHLYDEDRGFGWDTLEGLRQSETGIVSDSPEPRTFTADLPNGIYLLRFTQGRVEQATTVTEVHPGGMKPYPGHYTLADKMAWWQLPTSEEATERPPFFLPQLYGLPRPVEVKDGKLMVAFTPGSPREKPATARWQLARLEVIAMADHITALGDELVLSSKSAGKVMWVSPENGVVLDEVELPGVLDVALGGEGELFALLPDRVVAIDRREKVVKVRVSGLIGPVALDVDRMTGGILVAEGGKVQQVKCFAADGTLVASRGRLGGRQLGEYEANDYGDLAGIAADGRGGYVAIERRAVPRRTVHVNAQGEVRREWFGGMDFYSQTEIDPADPTIAWIRQDDTHLIRARLDYARGEWYPLSTYRWTELWDPDGPGSIFSHGPWLQRNPTFNRMRVLRRDLTGSGTTQLLIEFTALPMLLVHDEAMNRLRPLAALGMLNREYWADSTTAVDELPAAWAEAMRLAGADPADERSRNAHARYAWADENGDGLIDASELRLGEVHRHASSPVQGNGGYCLGIDDDLTCWVSNGDTRQGGLCRVYRPESFTGCGAPVWPLEGTLLGPTTEGRGTSTALVAARDGGVFVVMHGNGDGTRPSFTYDTAVHGWSWPSVMTDGVALMRLDADGLPLWRTSSKAARWPHPRGQLHGPWHLGGPIRDCVAVFDWLEQPCEFWTTDGLYVGGLFDGRDPHDGRDLSRPGSKPDPLYTWHGIRAKRIGGNRYFHENSLLAADDFRTGGEVALLPDGSVAFFGQGANNNPCYRITGWDGWHRQSGIITLAEAAHAGAVGEGRGLRAEIFPNVELSGEAVSRIDERLWFGIDKPWPAGTPESDFSVRWSGFLEPRFSESYCLSIYARGEFTLWVGGEQVAWAPQDYPRDREIRKGHSPAIHLEAGHRVPIMIEYRATMTTKAPHPDPSFHLNWESISQPVEHVPMAYLYPSVKEAVDE